MKRQFKLIPRFGTVSFGLVLAGLVLTAAVGLAQPTDIHFGPTGTEASISNPDGTWIQMWGSASGIATTFDTANPPPGGDTAGSVYNQGTWTAAAQDDYNMISPGTWWGAVVFDGSQYTNLEFDFKYDTNSTISPGSSAHLDFGYDTGYKLVAIQTLNTASMDPATSTPYFDGQWHHVQLAIPGTIQNVGSADGVGYYQWNANSSGTMNFWMANVVLRARVLPVPPPTLNAPAKTSDSGLSVYASTQGNTYYDRQSALYLTSSGTSWLSPGVTYPVSYSFTIEDFPTAPATYGCEAWLFLSPNPAAVDNAPDWNETNCVIAFVQLDTNGATMHFQYKVNEDHQQAMYSGGGPDTRAGATSTNNFYYTAAPGSLPGGAVTNIVSPGVYDITNESGNLGSIVNPGGAEGMWTITFTSANDVTLSAPNGSATNLVIPSYNVQYLDPAANGMNVYLGMQANNAASINQRVVYSNFAISGGVPAVFTDDFATDAVLDTNAWTTAQASGPKAILITKPGWIFTWSLPDADFSPEVGSDLTNTLAWTTPANSSPFPLYKESAQIVSGTDLPAGNTAFFRLIKRQFTQLQVLWPGETNAPDTATGKIGTPDPVSLSASSGLVQLTVNAVDSTYHIVNVTGDTITAAATNDPSIYWGGNVSLSGGTAQQYVSFGSTGTYTFTVQDTTNTNIPPATSSPITIDP